MHKGGSERLPGSGSALATNMPEGGSQEPRSRLRTSALEIGRHTLQTTASVVETALTRWRGRPPGIEAHGQMQQPHVNVEVVSVTPLTTPQEVPSPTTTDVVTAQDLSMMLRGKPGHRPDWENALATNAWRMRRAEIAEKERQDSERAAAEAAGQVPGSDRPDITSGTAQGADSTQLLDGEPKRHWYHGQDPRVLGAAQHMTRERVLSVTLPYYVTPHIVPPAAETTGASEPTLYDATQRTSIPPRDKI